MGAAVDAMPAGLLYHSVARASPYGAHGDGCADDDAEDTMNVLVEMASVESRDPGRDDRDVRARDGDSTGAALGVMNVKVGCAMLATTTMVICFFPLSVASRGWNTKLR